jgi:UDP-N-acetylmuramoyl-tripeptide--D-alanyl-D-alanine ligase
MKLIIQYILKILSRAILKKYHPDVIGITGSVGKTSTKKATDILLKAHYNVWASQKSYNTEIGVPLTIIGADNPHRSTLGWLTVFLKALWLIIKRQENYPRILVLEMAADHPGDIRYLVSFTKPKIGVITSVGPTHLEFFGSIDEVGKEKSNIINNLASSSYAIINGDQQMLRDLAEETQAKVLTFGLSRADVVADDIKISKKKGGLSFKLKYQKLSTRVEVPNLLGTPVVYSLLAAAAIGLCYNLSLDEISAELKNYQPLPGRLNLLPGIKYTRLIDDSYNASPLAVKSGLEILSNLFCSTSRFAVLGDMLELGFYTGKAHQEIGQLVAKLGIDYLVTVGQASLDTVAAAKESGMNPDRIFSFDNSVEAGKFLQDKIQEGDLIFIKGSAKLAMERIVKELMAEPERAGELLVRQETTNK